MKRLSILIATVCAALSGFAQVTFEISGELSDRLHIPLLDTPLLIQTEDEAIRDLALRKRSPNLTIGSHPYFRGPGTEASMEDFPGGRLFPAITPVQPGFQTFPLLEVEIEAIFIHAQVTTFLFNDLADQRTTFEHVAFDLTVPGGRRLHADSRIGDTVVGDFSPPTVAVVPEPGTCALLGFAGLVGWFIHRRRR